MFDVRRLDVHLYEKWLITFLSLVKLSQFLRISPTYTVLLVWPRNNTGNSICMVYGGISMFYKGEQLS